MLERFQSEHFRSLWSGCVGAICASGSWKRDVWGRLERCAFLQPSCLIVAGL